MLSISINTSLTIASRSRNIDRLAFFFSGVIPEHGRVPMVRIMIERGFPRHIPVLRIPVALSRSFRAVQMIGEIYD